MKIVKSIIVILIFTLMGVNCNINIFDLNEGEEKNERKQLYLYSLFALAQDQDITSYTGIMNNTQSGHTATLLNNGKVLIVGNGAELYDPDSETFLTIENSSSISRNYHSSVLLNNGKVLVIGGDNFSTGGTDIYDNLLYDPDTNVFSNTGNLITSRYGFSVVRLNNGKILVAGGNDSSSSNLDSAELYNPDTETFSITGNLNNVRHSFISVLLENGKVLIGTGLSSNGIVKRLEIYNPDTETFTNSIHTNYNVLSLLDNGKILSFGDEISDSCYELLSYDTITESFSNTGQCSKALTKNTKLNNGKILFSGGYNSGNIQKRLELYDPDEVKNTYIGNMKSSRYAHTATVLQDGRVLITGGVDSSGKSLSTAEIFSP